MPNLLAYLVFYGWPLAVISIFNKYSYVQAIFIVILTSQLYLPPDFGFDLPLIPPIDKLSLGSLCTALALYMRGKRFRILLPGAFTKILICYILSTFITTLLNGDPLFYGPLYIPGLTWYDGLSGAVGYLIFLLPLFIGRYFLNDVKVTGMLFETWLKISLFYSLLMLIEVKMSPQLNQWVYGYGIGSFLQQIRAGGFRPAVFVGHGLPLAFLFSLSIVAAITLMKNKVRVYFKPVLIVGYMFIVLLLSKTWSAMAYSLIGLFLIIYVKPEKIVTICLISSLTVLAYPISKTMHIFPEQEFLTIIGDSSADRAQSLGYRFDMENIALIRAQERLFFGWGGWGRGRVHSDDGKDQTVLDGRWILEFGSNGAIGFALSYLILLLPLFKARTAIKLIKDREDKVYFAGLAYIVALSIIDTIPNNSLFPISLLIVGTLMGQSEYIIKNSQKLKSQI